MIFANYQNRVIRKLMSRIDRRSRVIAGRCKSIPADARRFCDYKCIHRELAANAGVCASVTGPLATAQKQRFDYFVRQSSRNLFCAVKCLINRFRTSRQIFSIEFNGIHSINDASRITMARSSFWRAQCGIFERANYYYHFLIHQHRVSMNIPD